jgi:N-methylhydantoinase B
VRIEAPDGLICTAQHPAPVGSATVETIWVVTNVVQKALNLLLAASPQHAERAQAVSSGTMATFNLGGINQFGERFGLHLLDPLAGGSGAFACRDGIHAGGPVAVPMPAVADVESNEQVSPLFYLYRRLGLASGGAGRHRGGDAAEIALTLRAVAGAEALVMTHGAEVPNAAGLFGGWPGATVTQRFNGGRLGPKPGRIPMRPGDVFAVSWQGGGGFGDPLLRAPSDVASDVAAGLLSTRDAREVYGVVLDGTTVDGPATASCRARLRAGRIQADATPVDPILVDTGRALGPALRLVEAAGRIEVRSIAGAVLSTGSTRWRTGAVARPADAAAHGITLHEELAMTVFYCPVSGIQLAVDVHRAGEAPLDDIELGGES